MTDKQLVTNLRKANFDSIYDQPDPRAYFATLSALDYQIPQTALPVIENVLAASARDGGTPRDVLDVCCSYGINGALLRYDVTIDDLAEHYTSQPAADAGPDGVAAARAADSAWFAGRAARHSLNVYGLDASTPAITYATEVGLLTDGWAENLESDDVSAQLSSGVKGVGLITCTGGVGYIGAATFARLLSVVDDPADLWLAVFVLRAYSYDGVAEVLTDAGLVTEQLPGVTFKQRRFASAEEQDTALAEVRARGLDPAGKEDDGWFHADCYITRPAAAAAANPVTDLLPG